MEPLTGLAALAGVSLATIAGLRLKKQSEEGFASLPPRDYTAAVNESQTRYNMFSGIVNPITNAIIPVGSSTSKINTERDRVRSALGSYSAEFTPSSKETVVLKKFQNQLRPQTDGSKSLYAAARFCRSAGQGNMPFTTYNQDGSVRTRGAVDSTGTWKFDEVCGVCLTDGVDEEGNRFRKQQGMLVEPGMREDAYQEQEDNGWSYPRVGPSIGSCNGAPNGPMFATNAKDLERFRRRKACAETKALGGAADCGLCYDSDVFSSIPPDTEINDIEIHVYGIGTLTYRRAAEEVAGHILQEQTPFVITVQNPKETESFTLSVAPVQGRETATSIWGFLQSKTPREGVWAMPLNLLMTIDDATGATPSKSGGFFRFEQIGLDVAKMRPGAGKQEMRLRGIIPFTFVNAATFPAMDCLDGPFQTKAQSLSAFATDQPCFAKGSRPGNYNDACLRARILDAGCTNEGDLFKNPRVLNLKDGAEQNLNQIYDTLQEIAMNDMVDPVATKQCSGRTVSTPCDPFILRQGTLKIGEAMRGSNPRLKTQGEQCLSFLYHNRGANEIAKPPRVGPTYEGLPGYRNNRQNQKNIFCLPEGSLNPDTNTTGRETLARIADNGYRNRVGVDAVKLYLTDQLALATDSMRNANTDPERKAAIVNCFGRNLTELPSAVTGNPRVVENPCGILAQFVRVLPSQQVGDSFIEISQIVVIDKNGENVAIGKSTAGTTAAWPSGSFGSLDASKAIDGQMFPKAQNFYHSATAGGNTQFLLNLGAVTDITKIIYYTRGDNRTTHHRKQGIRLQLLDANQRVLDEKLLNNQLVEEITYLQAGAPSSCKSSLPAPAPFVFPAGMSPGLFVRFFAVSDANPDITPGNRGWGERIGTPAAYASIQNFQNSFPRPTNVGIVIKGYYVAQRPERLQFSTTSDDGIYVQFDGRQVISDWRSKAASVVESAAIPIAAAGVYPVEIRFYQGGGPGTLSVSYRINDEPYQTDLSKRFGYKPSDVAQEEATYQARIRAQQQAAAAAQAVQQVTTGLRFTINGRPWKNENGVIRLNRGVDITFDIVRRNDLYKSNEGYIALKQSGTQNYLRHSGLVSQLSPFTPNNGDFAWKLVPSGAGFMLKNEFGIMPWQWLGYGNASRSSTLGYDANSDTILLRSFMSPGQFVAWTITPRPTI